jgi:hypothetical protein
MSGVARSIFRSICGRTGRGVTGGAERSPWVTDIHNGISNPLFTYTGGQAIVPDENGILRRTPAGYPAVEGGAWSGTNWLPPTAGTTRSISTRKGLRTIQTADTFEGMLIEPAMTNKVTARKSNPTDTTGVTGAGGATVTRVLDTVALTAGGYQDICTTFYDYELSIPQNGTISMAGAVANLNKHSVSLDMRLVSGTGVQFGLTGQTSDVTLTAAFSRQKKENLTPLAITDVITITNLNADTAVVRCILPGLEESAFCTSRIAPAADTAAAQTRAASAAYAPTAGVFPSSGQDFAIFMRIVLNTAAQPASQYIFSADTNASNKIRTYLSSTSNIVTIKTIGGVNVSIPAFLLTFSPGNTADIILMQTSAGLVHRHRIFNGAAWGAWSGWTGLTDANSKLPIQLTSTYQIGAYAGLSQYTGNYPRAAIIAMPPKATLAEYQAWIEAELTRRGLIGDDNDDFPYSLPFTLE